MIQRDFLNFLCTPEEMEFTGKFDIPKLKGIKVKSIEHFKPELNIKVI